MSISDTPLSAKVDGGFVLAANKCGTDINLVLKVHGQKDKNVCHLKGGYNTLKSIIRNQFQTIEKMLVEGCGVPMRDAQALLKELFSKM